MSCPAQWPPRSNMREFNINMEGYNVNGVCVVCLAHGRRMYYLKEVPVYFRLLGDIEIPPGVSVQVCWECTAAVAGVRRFQDLVRASFAVLEEYSRQNPFLNSPSDLSEHGAARLGVARVQLHEFTVPQPPPPPAPAVAVAVKEEDELKFEHIEVAIEDKDVVKVELPAEYSYFLEDAAASDGGGVASGAASDDESLALLSARKRRRGRPAGRTEVAVGGEREKKQRRKRRERDAGADKTSRSDDSKERRALQLKHYRKLSNLPPGTVRPLDLDEEEMRRLRAQDAINPDFTKLKFKCDDCLMGFNSQKLLDDHLARKHQPKDANGHQCDVCRAYLLTADNVSVHRRLHLVGYRCLLCEFRTGVKQLAMRHAKRHLRRERPGEWPCTACERVFSSKSKLSYHRGAIHQERPQCDCCGKVFANKMTLKYHLKILPQDKEVKRPKEKLYLPCKGCGKVFHSRKSYRAHAVIHEGLEYPCPVCGKLFQWKRNLARHIRNHREKDTGTFYECRPCNKRFSSKDCFNNHMKFSKKHVSEESYGHECEHCGKKFATKWCLVDHVDWDHFRKIKYECRYCLKAFKTAKIMMAHIHNIHEHRRSDGQLEGEHLCDICGKSYKTEKRLKGHVWAMHTHRATAKTFRCKLCPATFTWQTSIYKHVKMMHENRDKRKSRLLVRTKRADASPPPPLGVPFFHPGVQSCLGGEHPLL